MTHQWANAQYTDSLKDGPRLVDYSNCFSTEDAELLLWLIHTERDRKGDGTGTRTRTIGTISFCSYSYPLPV